jgi:hypothetical protein
MKLENQNTHAPLGACLLALSPVPQPHNFMNTFFISLYQQPQYIFHPSPCCIYMSVVTMEIAFGFGNKETSEYHIEVRKPCWSPKRRWKCNGDRNCSEKEYVNWIGLRSGTIAVFVIICAHVEVP